MIQTYDQLITLAHGTAAKPVRDGQRSSSPGLRFLGRSMSEVWCR